MRYHPEIEDVIRPVGVAPLDLPSDDQITHTVADIVRAVNDEHYSVLYLGTGVCLNVCLCTSICAFCCQLTMSLVMLKGFISHLKATKLFSVLQLHCPHISSIYIYLCSPFLKNCFSLQYNTLHFTSAGQGKANTASDEQLLHVSHSHYTVPVQHTTLDQKRKTNTD